MRLLSAAMLLSISAVPVAASAQTAATAPTAEATDHYSVETTNIGAVLDDPAAKAVVDKHIPGFSSQPQIDMGRAMTLKSVQQYMSDRMTDKVLAEIQLDFNKMPIKK